MNIGRAPFAWATSTSTNPLPQHCRHMAGRRGTGAAKTTAAECIPAAAPATTTRSVGARRGPPSKHRRSIGCWV